MDKDLASIQEARDMLRTAETAGRQLLEMDQSHIDQICANMAAKGEQAAERLARMAVDETGFGRYEDKVVKNRFATRDLWEYIRDMKTCDVINYDADKRLYEIAVPMGTVAGIVPSTNPTSTAMYKAIIALKSRNPIIISPHPGAAGSIIEASRIMAEAAVSAGAPRNSVQCITQPTLGGTMELMRSSQTGVILATGGSGLVKSAYSSGRPAYGVGPGNVPAYIEKSANVPKAVADIAAGKSFDNGTVCASEQSVIVDRVVNSQVMDEFRKNNAYFCDSREKQLLEKLMINEKKQLNHAIVGKSPQWLAEQAGFSVPKNIRLLVALMEKVGPEDPLSLEKLSPVLTYYQVQNWEEGCTRAIEVLKYGGIGHSMSIHSANPDIIMEFALKKPAMRILANTSSTHGAIGYTTGLAPSMTLGCGTWGGSITTDNVDPLHLVNIKRLAYETRSLWDEKPTAQTGWRYDEEYRYRPPAQEDSEQPNSATSAEPDRYGGSRLSDEDVERIMREFKNR